MQVSVPPYPTTVLSKVLQRKLGLGTVEGDTMAQPQSITSSSTAKGAVPTQELATCHVYAEVDPSKKTLRRGDAS